MNLAVATILTAVGISAPLGLSLEGPRLSRGDEITFTGHVTEQCEHVSSRFQKRAKIDVTLFVLDVRPEHTDLAVMTRLQPEVDEKIAQAAQFVTGQSLGGHSAAVTLELIRVDRRGRVTLLAPEPGPPPIPLTARTPTAPAPALPLDTPPLIEWGMFVPMPNDAGVQIGDRWKTDSSPEKVWHAERETVRHGGRAISLVAVRQSDDWADPERAFAGWKLTERLLVHPSDGVAAKLYRKVEHREGKSVVRWLELDLEMQPTKRLLGFRYDDARKEIETAYGYASELKAQQRQGRPSREWCQSRLFRLERARADLPEVGSFRPALESVQRQFQAGAEGKLLPPSPIRLASGMTETQESEPVSVAVGDRFPTLVAPWANRPGEFRSNSEEAGKSPIVLVLVDPTKPTAKSTLIIAEALATYFNSRAEVVAVAMTSEKAEVRKLIDQLRLKVPIALGDTWKDKFDLSEGPMFYVIDKKRKLAFHTQGLDANTGFRLREQVDKLLD